MLNLSDEDSRTLDGLNAAVKDALEKRKAWLDSAMVRLSPLKVGDELWDVGNMRRLGVITKLYRYHAEHSPLLDDDVTVSYEYERPSGGVDNTSRQIGLTVGTKDEAIEAHERMIERARSEPECEPRLTLREKLARDLRGAGFDV